MKYIGEINANRKPVTTPILLVGWLVTSPTRDTSPICDYCALQDTEAAGCVLSNKCCPMLLFHPKVALKGTLKDVQPMEVSDISTCRINP